MPPDEMLFSSAAWGVVVRGSTSESNQLRWEELPLKGIASQTCLRLVATTDSQRLLEDEAVKQLF